MTSPVHFDISQLVIEPRRTGIQRVQRELVRHWPGPAPLIPVRYNQSNGAFERLRDCVLDYLCRDAKAGVAGAMEEAEELKPHLQSTTAINTAHERITLLQTELFHSKERAGFLRGLAQAGRHDVAMLVHDFLPWLQPQYFGPGAGKAMMHYLYALRSATRIAFVSEQTRKEWRARISRNIGMDGPVFSEGGDGLRLERQQFYPEREGYVLVGTIEARKNVLAAIDAFEILNQKDGGPKLWLVGRLDPALRTEAAVIRRLSGVPWLEHIDGATDDELRNILRRVRAMVFPSENEGFGLPPFECLHAGVPVIVYAKLPSISLLPTDGQVRLPRCSPTAIADAVMFLENNESACRLWEHASRIMVPSWQDFSRNVADWVTLGRA